MLGLLALGRPGPAHRWIAIGVAVAVLAVAPLRPATPPSAGTAVPSTATASAASDACGPVRLKANGTAWSCTFVDNFGRASLDPDRWTVQETERTGFRTGRTCYVDSPRTVALRDGALHLTTHEGGWFRCRNPLQSFSTRYTGGMVGTRDRFSQTYGLFEVRARYPDVRVPGLHGGFWMYPLRHTYGAWPSSGELDVAEWWSNDPGLALPSLHYDGRSSEHDSGWECRVTDPSRYHVYSVQWSRTSMLFLIDGRPCFVRRWQPDAPLRAPQPFDHPFSMILNLGVGPATGVNKVSYRTPFPATYVVDYAKAWR